MDRKEHFEFLISKYFESQYPLLGELFDEKVKYLVASELKVTLDVVDDFEADLLDALETGEWRYAPYLGEDPNDWVERIVETYSRLDGIGKGDDWDDETMYEMKEKNKLRLRSTYNCLKRRKNRPHGESRCPFTGTIRKITKWVLGKWMKQAARVEEELPLSWE